MTITTLTSREFNQDTAKAKRAAADGPVYITDRGKPAHVLLSFDTYQRLAAQGAPPDKTAQGKTILDLLAMPSAYARIADIDVDFDSVRSKEPGRIAEFD
ncbi:MAG TPA: type II toxin-antitoxin system Phd/YefM family antitoxin [Rhodopila sp.]|uniref:type II toxin-antitoxin system Phd/YefM family antitoxin n=1 Tax=Rhodopila sp. TaxID=2480087 RepID=UPI002BD86F4A|nr:type II toxin-antitoxin system Phd/YefM family antitoxin [Rhodopila sp.]HVY13666.1 type II toxin-antitoxin system Phd/YefM family antitoxin [Rhodopila sp.]